jgi:predicted RNA-binding protein YlqC (UPF0109 family)
MKEFVEYIAKCLVDTPDAVEVTEQSVDDKKIILSLKVAQNDVGKVIGKEGRIIIAMRTLVSAIAARDKKKVIVEIDDGVLHREK